MDWNYTACDRLLVAFVSSTGDLAYFLASASKDARLDVGRVIVDRFGGSDEFLKLLIALPSEFTGDVLLIRSDGTGVLSATARGGGRVLYSLLESDVWFYLETHELVTGRMMQMIA